MAGPWEDVYALAHAVIERTIAEWKGGGERRSSKNSGAASPRLWLAALCLRKGAGKISRVTEICPVDQKQRSDVNNLTLRDSQAIICRLLTDLTLPVRWSS